MHSLHFRQKFEIFYKKPRHLWIKRGFAMDLGKVKLVGLILTGMCLFSATKALSRSPQSENAHSHKLASISASAFAGFFAHEPNYNRVYWDVMGWFGSTRNGCVAFASTALRFLGAPLSIEQIYNGERVSLLTRPFSAYLEQRMGWTRVKSSTQLVPGDLVFTTDEPTAPGYPAHVFMHNGYADAAKTISWAIDNQDFTHERALGGDKQKDYSPFAYALRSPVR